jgi:predicted nucleic acid-binding protein
MMVVDASVLVPALSDDGSQGELARARLRGERLLAPEIVDLEVVSAWRRLTRSGRLELRRVAFALCDLAALPLLRAPHRPLAERVWALRHNLTAYDASYIALAELAGARLLTLDDALARAPGISCEVDVLAPEPDG